MSDLTKAADDVIEELQKALGDGSDERIAKAVKKSEDEDEPVEDEGVDEEAEEDEEPEDDGEPVAKSIYEEIQEDHSDYLDVSPLLDRMVKSMDTLGRGQSESDRMLKAVAKATLMNSQILKGLLEEPEVRKSVLHKRERFAGEAKSEPTDRRVLMTQIKKALRDGDLTLRQASIAEDRINKGMDLPTEVGVILKAM